MPITHSIIHVCYRIDVAPKNGTSLFGRRRGWGVDDDSVSNVVRCLAVSGPLIRAAGSVEIGWLIGLRAGYCGGIDCGNQLSEHLLFESGARRWRRNCRMWSIL